MRVLVLSEFYPHNKNPAEGIVVREQLLQLSRHCDVRVLAPAMRHLPLPRYRILRRHESSTGHFVDPMAVERFPVWNLPLMGEIVASRMHERAAKSILARVAFAPDLIHAHWAYRSGFVGARLQVQYSCPLIITVHGSDINFWLHEFGKRNKILYALQRAAAIIAVSRELTEHIAAEGIAAGKIHYIPNGVDLAAFGPRPSAVKQEMRRRFGDVPLYLCVANIFHVKGQDVLLRALALLRGSAAAVLVGDGPERPRLEKLARQLQLTRRVYFAGQKSHAEVAEWMNASDALVIPSRNEGCPLAALEALACGLPVVSTKVGMVPEAISSEDYGLLVPVEDPPALAAALSNAVQRIWDKSKLRARAEAFSLERLCIQVLQVYRSVLGDRRK